MNSHQAQVILSLAGFKMNSVDLATGDFGFARDLNGITILGCTVYSRTEPGVLIYAFVASYESDELYKGNSTPIRKVRLENSSSENLVLEALKMASRYAAELAVAS
jgi:hypothetical protein